VVAPVVASERDLRALAAIVSEDRPDLSDGEGLPPSLLADLMGQIRCDVISLDRGKSGRHAYSILQAIPALSDDELTPRQTDLLHLLAAGHTNTQIARRLGISEGTVRTHLENLYGRLNVSSRTAAVTRAFSGQVE
jgi:DNA-binding NarL/FixJ family response regulator